MDWFRFYNEFADDPKVQMMSEAMQRRLAMLFCIQSKSGIETFPETDREQLIAFTLRITIAELAETRALFLQKGFINPDFTLCNWKKRQYLSDSSTERVRKCREKKKQSETFPKRFSNGTRADSEQIQNRTETTATPFPEAAARIRFFHPATDQEMISQIVDLVIARIPDAGDAYIADLLKHSHQGTRQRSAALWLRTLPEYLTTLLGSGNQAAAEPEPEIPQRTKAEAIHRLTELLNFKGVPQNIRDGWQRELDGLQVDDAPKKPPLSESNLSVMPRREAVQ